MKRMETKDMNKYAYELMVKNNPQEAIKNLIMKDSDIEDLKKDRASLIHSEVKLREDKIKLQQRIDKAIEYIKKVSNNGMFELRMEEIEELLDILKGSDN